MTPHLTKLIKDFANAVSVQANICEANVKQGGRSQNRRMLKGLPL